MSGPRTFDGIALDSETGSEATHNKVSENDGPGIGMYDSQSSTVLQNKVEDNSDSGISLNNADSNTIGHNEVKKNGTPNGDTTDGIQVDVLSASNTLHDNHLKDNVTHDCHDDSLGSGTANTANTWVYNHCETSMPPGLCGSGGSSFTLSAAYGWDANYAWYNAFTDAVEYDWPAVYRTIDTDSLLQLLPRIGMGLIRGKTLSPAP